MKGWAFSGGGRGIQRVDVSLDGGRSWTPAQTLERVPGDGDGFEDGPAVVLDAVDCRGRQAARGLQRVRENWRSWLRAVDSACNVQPEEARARSGT